MLGENAQVKWARIVDTQVGVMPWKDLQGDVHQAVCSYSADSFRECVNFHLLLVFTYDAAEHQKYYVSHQLKNSRKDLLRNFCDRIKQLHRYIPYLPGLVDSPQGANMKSAEALTET